MAKAAALQEIINEDEGTDLADAISDALSASTAGDPEPEPEPAADAKAAAKAEADATETTGAEADAGDDDKEPDDDTDDEIDAAGAGEEPGDADKEPAKAEEDAAPQGGDGKTDQAGTADTGAEAPIDPPPRFSEAHKETFRSLPRPAQVFLTDRHQDMEADYTRKSQEVAEARKAADAMNSAVQPWSTYIASLGTTPEVAFDTLMKHDHGLRTGTDNEKRQRFAQLAQHYGIDLEALSDEDVAPQDPAIAHLNQQVAQVRAAQAAQSQQADTEADQQLEARIQSFATDTDAEGKLTHPDFEDVRLQMSGLMVATPELGMEDAYRDAVWSSPKLREAKLAEDRRQVETEAATKAAEEKAKEKTARAEKAKQARKASVAVGGGSEQPGPAAEPSAASLGDELERVYREAASSA